MPGFPENCQKLTLIMWLYGTLRGFALCSLYKQTVCLKITMITCFQCLGVLGNEIVAIFMVCAKSARNSVGKTFSTCAAYAGGTAKPEGQSTSNSLKYK